MDVETKPRFTLRKLLFIVACAAATFWLVTPPWFSSSNWIPDEPKYRYEPAILNSDIVERAAACLVALPFRLATIAFVYVMYAMVRRLIRSRGS